MILPQVASGFFRQLTTGIFYLHEKNICHCALRPDILIAKNNDISATVYSRKLAASVSHPRLTFSSRNFSQVKICDLSYAKLVLPPNSSSVMGRFGSAGGLPLSHTRPAAAITRQAFVCNRAVLLVQIASTGGDLVRTHARAHAHTVTSHTRTQTVTHTRTLTHTHTLRYTYTP